MRERDGGDQFEPLPGARARRRRRRGPPDPVGRVLRDSLDELPQFINVLRGE